MHTIKVESCNGGKVVKECPIVLLCCNVDGSKKQTLLVIDCGIKPRCLKNIKTFLTSYKINKKCRMTEVILQDYLWQLDKKMQLRNNKIILIVDQCTAHKNVTLKNVHIELLQPNCTNTLQTVQ